MIYTKITFYFVFMFVNISHYLNMILFQMTFVDVRWVVADEKTGEFDDSSPTKHVLYRVFSEQSSPQVNLYWFCW